MKILSYKNFLNELLKDEIPDHLKDIISKDYPYDDYLEYDVPVSNSIIPEVNLLITEEKYEVCELIRVNFAQGLVDHFTTTDLYDKIYYDNLFRLYIEKALTEEFKLNINFLKKLMSNDYLCPVPNEKVILKVFTNYEGQLFWADNESKKINKDNIIAYIVPTGTEERIEIISKKTGYYKKLVNDGDIVNSKTQIIEIYQDKKDPVFFDNRKINLNQFIKVFKDLFDFSYDIVSDVVLEGIKSEIINFDSTIEGLNKSNLSLIVTSKPEDKLNMSISRFYDSCQNILTGEHKLRLLSNVFDPNMKVAYLRFDLPYIGKIKYSYSNVSRCIIRYANGKLMFDTVYPKYMKVLMYSILEKYTGIKNNGNSKDVYNFKSIKGLPLPYMDTYKLDIDGTNLEEQKLNAMVYMLKVKPDKIEKNGDYYLYNDNKYLVIDKDDSYEKCVEYFNDNYFMLMDSYTPDDLMSKGIITQKERSIWITYFKTTIKEWIIKNNIVQVKNLKNLNKLLTKRIVELSLQEYCESNDIDMKEIRELIFMGKEFTLKAYDEFFIYKINK